MVEYRANLVDVFSGPPPELALRIDHQAVMLDGTDLVHGVGGILAGL